MWSKWMNFWSEWINNDKSNFPINTKYNKDNIEELIERTHELYLILKMWDEKEKKLYTKKYIKKQLRIHDYWHKQLKEEIDNE